MDASRVCAARRLLRAIDVTFIGYSFACLCGWIAVGAADSLAPALAAANGVVVLLFTALACWMPGAGEPRRQDIFRRILLVTVVLIFDFTQIGLLITHLRPDAYLRVEPLLLEADRWIFGTDPTRWLERWHHPALTELLQWVYASFYFLPFVLAGFVWPRADMALRAKIIFAVTAGFLSSYAGYFVFPARYPLYVIHEPGPLEGIFAAEFLWRLLIDTLELTKFDAFPSGHTEVSLIVLYYAWRHSRPAFRILFPVISLLVFSTVYLRYHYFVDLVAGALLAAAVIGLAAAVERGFTVRGSARSPSRRSGSA